MRKGPDEQSLASSMLFGSLNDYGPKTAENNSCLIAEGWPLASTIKYASVDEETADTVEKVSCMAANEQWRELVILIAKTSKC